MTNLIERLPEGPLDIVGDVHGEYDALLAILRELGYEPSGTHPAHRKLVFVGDLCDRGPDSIRVIGLVQRLVESGKALAVLGNHELNLLRNEAKDGSGWYFDERLEKDARYRPFARPSGEEKAAIVAFLEKLPLILERDDLRVVHAAWQRQDVKQIREAGRIGARELYDRFQARIDRTLVENGIYPRYREESLRWKEELEQADFPMHFIDSIADYEEASQAGNPVRVLTSGVERRAERPFYSSHKWRFVNRIRWWEEYEDDIPVIIGHYWRMSVPADLSSVGKSGYLFGGLTPGQWHGARENVFCVDFSVGGRWHERRDGTPPGKRFRLAAMRWPEAELVFDDGQRFQTLPGG